MIAAIKKILTVKSSGAVQTSDARLAAAMIMLEVASADFELQGDERSLLQERIGVSFGVDGKELSFLVEKAVSQHDQTTSLHDEIAIINATFDAGSKRRLLEDLWSIAYVDGHLHHYEEAVIRRLADLLHVPHLDFIRAKHRATGEM